jgi:DnaJ-domain-containing protein 1
LAEAVAEAVAAQAELQKLMRFCRMCHGWQKLLRFRQKLLRISLTADSAFDHIDLHY